MDEDFDWISASDAARPEIRKRQPQVDAAVSKILGRPILVNDQRLVSLVVKYKKLRASDPDSDKMDNFLYDPDFLTELHKTFV